MSFGFSVGDFLAVGQLSWKIYKKCKDSPEDYVKLSNEVGALHNVMKETEELFSQQDLTPQQENRLLACQQGCEKVLNDLDGLLVKYESLGTKSRRTIDRMGFGTHDMNDIRSRLNLNVSMLDAFNNASSLKRLESKLNLLIAEARAGKREGSVISTQTFDTTARNDQETWEALRRELEDIGISPGVITEKWQFIIAWFREATAAGRLEEDLASDDSNSAISLHESEDPACASDDDNNPSREVSTMRLEPSTTQRRAGPQSGLSASRALMRPDDRSSSPLPQRKGKSRFSVTYLLQKLLGSNDQLLQAARTGDISKLKSLLEKGVDIQTRGLVDGNTVLHQASKYRQEKTVQFLLSLGADVHAKNDAGETALYYAALSRDKRIVDLLLEQGADIESKNSNGDTALICAAVYGHYDTMQLLLEKGADIESKNSNGDTVLMNAAVYGHYDTMQLLLEKGADVDAKNSTGGTALICAAIYGHYGTMQLLLEKGADIESKNSNGDTALICAAIYGHYGTMQLLLEKGADIESKNSTGNTALISTAVYRNYNTVQLLLEKGADVDVKNSTGATALMEAAHRGHKDSVQLLLNMGAKIDTEDVHGHSALYYAKIFSERETKFILDRKKPDDLAAPPSSKQRHSLTLRVVEDGHSSNPPLDNANDPLLSQITSSAAQKVERTQMGQ